MERSDEPKIDPAVARRLQREDLATILKRGVGYAVNLGNTPEDAEDLAYSALSQVLGGKPPIGAEETVESVVLDVIWSLHGNRRKALKRKGDRPLDPERDRRVAAPTPNPEQALEWVQAEVDLEALHAEVRASFS